MLITNFWHFPEEKASARYTTLATLLAEAGHEVEVVTSSFHHASKRQRDPDIVHSVGGYKVTLIHEPSYPRNVSLRRLRSHESFSRSVVRYLGRTPLPDVIYVVVPSLSLGDHVTSFAKKNRVKVVMDVQDLWPEAFAMAIPSRFLFRALSLPMMLQANRVYARADALVAVSETYRARVVGKPADRPSLAVYLGLELDRFDRPTAEPVLVKPDGAIWLAYAGTLGRSYDLPTLIAACALLKARGGDHIELIVLGDGPRRAEFEALAAQARVPARFLGFVAYDVMASTLRESDIAVNPIDGRSEASIINKHADYLAAGIPMINSQASSELIDLLDRWNAGLTCQPGSPELMAEALAALIGDPELRHLMGGNARRLAEARFDRASTYPSIVELVERV
ncbi:glycosyltransferase family 4 protein [Tessaracoccus sp. MC1756]|uniref:glycosyltransferase family 4 protein n=1 Tax=Tessaracoccus sp. MC1756 TaxID=2760311 RepID=UPI00160486F4|nr:glycosyltransferase family 4 protein [Tessaracoccus sp. MC1756]MBB1509828.1 glycosyltransferase family 4 protein [Tessaracoccus sp. MC1756]